MLGFESLTTDPTTGKSLTVPEGFNNGVKRAFLFLEAELREVVDRFGAEAKWQFEGTSEIADRVKLVLTAGFPGGRVEKTFSPEDLKDDTIMQRRIRPLLSQLAVELSANVKRELNEIQKRIHHDLEALATIVEE